MGCVTWFHAPGPLLWRRTALLQGAVLSGRREGDEYDPAVPNEFSAILRERKQRLEAAQAALGKIQDEVRGAGRGDCILPYGPVEGVPCTEILIVADDGSAGRG